MKKLILILAILPIFAIADVVINDDGTIVKDGVSLNNSWDALLNKQVTNAEFAAAWNAKFGDFKARLAQKDKDAQTAIVEATQTLISERNAANEAAAKSKSEADVAKEQAKAAIAEAAEKKKEVEGKFAALLAGARDALALPTSEERVAAAMKLIEQVQQSEAEKELALIQKRLQEDAKRAAELRDALSK